MFQVHNGCVPGLCQCAKVVLCALCAGYIKGDAIEVKENNRQM